MEICLGLMGKLILGVKVVIVDNEGNEVFFYIMGNLVIVKGWLFMMCGIWNN